jgi:CDP-diacylglycerol--inositol 3-phosphatidyltransferase
LIAFCTALDHPLICVISYATSYLLDAADGFAARSLNQASNFGAVLDMVTDRFSTAGFLATMGHLYPSYRFIFICVMVLDFTSHWMQMYS